MSFEKYICWNPEELSRVIHTEAEATQESLFLAIHTDSKIKVSISGSKAKNITYQAFLKDFLEGEHGNNVQAVIEGESGAGKSHLVQWMRFNISQNKKRIVITIAKTQNNLYSVLKKLVAHLPNEEQIKYNEKLQRTESGLKNDTERINEFLSSLARTIEKDIPQGINQEEEEYLIPLLPKLFDDPYFRDKFFNNHEIINNIILLIFSNSAINRNSENRQEFKQQHLPLNAKEATNSSQSTQEVLVALQEEEFFIHRLPTDALTYQIRKDDGACEKSGCRPSCDRPLCTPRRQVYYRSFRRNQGPELLSLRYRQEHNSAPDLSARRVEKRGCEGVRLEDRGFERFRYTEGVERNLFCRDHLYRCLKRLCQG